MGFFFKRSSIFNVRMVITEEKILSNIEKLKKLIDPEEEKLIVRLEEDRYFKDLVESITVYLINYPSKNQFPLAVYEAAYNLVEFVTAEFEKNSVKAEELLEKRNKFLKESYLLKDALITVKEKKEGWIENLSAFEGKFSEDIAEALTVIANSSIKDEKEVDEAEKMINSKISSLESNLYLEIDLDNIESESRALSFVGIEIAEALKHVNPPNAEDGSKKKRILISKK